VEQEIWKDIAGYEGIYQVSNMGRVKSLDRLDRLGRRTYGCIRIPSKGKTGYLNVNLRNGYEKRFYIHRLVAEAFIPNPENLPCINHRDEDKENNSIDNLEWCSHKYNNSHGTRIDRICANDEYKNSRDRSTRKAADKCFKPVLQFDKSGNFICKYESGVAAATETGISTALISQCCLGKIKTAKGYIWKHAE